MRKENIYPIIPLTGFTITSAMIYRPLLIIPLLMWCVWGYITYKSESLNAK